MNESLARGARDGDVRRMAMICMRRGACSESSLLGRGSEGARACGGGTRRGEAQGRPKEMKEAHVDVHLSRLETKQAKETIIARKRPKREPQEKGGRLGWGGQTGSEARREHAEGHEQCRPV